MRYLTCVILFLFSGSLFAASITAQTDRSSISINESFSLILEATGSVDDDPDFTPLEQDFDILNRSQSSNISYINGNYSKSQTWTLQLMARREGMLTIPSLSFGKDSSPQLRITVKAASQADPANRDIFLEAEVSTRDAYVQQQILFTLRLLTAVNLSAVNFSELKTENIDTRIEALSDGRQYRTQRGNRAYLVVEKQYALFPQQQGSLHIPSLLAEATTGSRAQSLFDPFNRGSQIQRFRSPSFDINIKTPPAGFKGATWLPATELQLVEEWPDKKELKAGEPITRTISILANGLTAEQLPALVFSDLANIKQYPDQASLNNSKQDDGIIGIRQQKIALIPVTGGRYTLPAIEIPWWNLKTNQLEIARLAERSFMVGPSAIDKPASTPAEPVTPVPVAPTPDALPRAASPDSPRAYSSLWLSLFLATGWLVTGLAWWRSSRKPYTATAREHPQPALAIKPALQQLRRACDNNDAKLCRTALLNWGRAVFGAQRIHTLNDLAQHIQNTRLSAEIARLNSALYSPQTQAWHGASLWQLVQQLDIQGMTGQSRNTDLEPMYRL